MNAKERRRLKRAEQREAQEAPLPPTAPAQPLVKNPPSNKGSLVHDVEGLNAKQRRMLKRAAEREASAQPPPAGDGPGASASNLAATGTPGDQASVMLLPSGWHHHDARGRG
jgi:hypothetical protein